MNIYSTKEFKHGWFVGNFEPSIIKSKECEVAYHQYPKGHKSDGHYHKVATEINLVVWGKALVDGHGLNPGLMWVTNPGEAPKVEYLENTGLIVIKCPSVPGDKYYDPQNTYELTPLDALNIVSPFIKRECNER